MTDFASLFLLLTLTTTAASLLVGTVAGYMLSTAPSGSLTVRNALYIGMPFVATVGAARFAEGVRSWDAWIGFAVVFTVYAIGLGIGRHLRLARLRGE